MNDLISKQAAIDEIDEWIKAFLENGHKESAADACLIQDGIIQLPSTQPEIVRCKDCMHKPALDEDGELHFPTYQCPCQCADFYYSQMPKDDFYCGYAERRTDDK